MKPIKYRVLLAEQLSKADKLAVAAELATLKTADEARLLAQGRPLAQEVNHWTCEVYDFLGRVVVMKFRGAEVAQFYKRQIATLEPLPQDPVPEGVINDPKDAWMRIDLLGVSSRNLAARVGKNAKSVSELLDLSQRELQAKDDLIQELNHEVFKLTKKVEGYEKRSRKPKSGRNNQGAVQQKGMVSI